MSRRLPDFIVVGAMKSATTTLHEQLARQPGLSMSRPKEPNFFSDDDQYRRGLDHYARAFEWAAHDDRIGESSTHYTKLPTYPRTIERMSKTLDRCRFVYVMRHPIDRLKSHYVHDVADGRIDPSLGVQSAAAEHPELIEYGRYAMQLAPYFQAFGRENVLPVFFDRLIAAPQLELERICEFIGMDGRPTWDESIGALNAGRKRLRPSPIRDALVQSPILNEIRRSIVPRSVNDSVKSFWRAKVPRPAPSVQAVERWEAIFDEDLAKLGEWLGCALSCDNFHEVAAAEPTGWR